MPVRSGWTSRAGIRSVEPGYLDLAATLRMVEAQRLEAEAHLDQHGGKQAEAESELARAVERDPKNFPLLAGAAYWYAANKQGDKADENAQKAIDIEPRYVWSHNAMGDIQAITYFDDTVYFGFHDVIVHQRIAHRLSALIENLPAHPGNLAHGRRNPVIDHQHQSERRQ